MLVMRPAQMADLGEVQRLAADSPIGVTSLPDDVERLSDKIAAMAADAKSIIFGNTSYYCFVENGSLEVSRNPYLYQANYQTAIFVNYRFGGDVTQPEAFVYGVHPSA